MGRNPINHGIQNQSSSSRQPLLRAIRSNYLLLHWHLILLLQHLFLFLIPQIRVLLLLQHFLLILLV